MVISKVITEYKLWGGGSSDETSSVQANIQGGGRGGKGRALQHHACLCSASCMLSGFSMEHHGSFVHHAGRYSPASQVYTRMFCLTCILPCVADTSFLWKSNSKADWTNSYYEGYIALLHSLGHFEIFNLVNSFNISNFTNCLMDKTSSVSCYIDVLILFSIIEKAALTSLHWTERERIYILLSLSHTAVQWPASRRVWPNTARPHRHLRSFRRGR